MSRPPPEPPDSETPAPTCCSDCADGGSCARRTPNPARDTSHVPPDVSRTDSVPDRVSIPVPDFAPASVSTADPPDVSNVGSVPDRPVSHESRTSHQTVHDRDSESLDSSDSAPIFSILNLAERDEAFEHDAEVERFLRDDPSVDSETESLPDLFTRDDDSSISGSTCSTCSLTSLSSDEETHWRFKRTGVSRSRERLRGPRKKIKRKRKKGSLADECPAIISDFMDVINTEPRPTPSVLGALNRASRDIQELGISVVDYYKDLEVQSVHLSSKVPPKGHVDGGALATTCNRLEYIWCYRKFSVEERRHVARLKVADDSIHVPTGIGYLKVPCTTSPGYMFVETFYTPEIPATILSPHMMAKVLSCRGYETFSNIVEDKATMRLVDCARCETSVDFDLHLIRGLLYTDSIIMPTTTEHEADSLPEDSPCPPRGTVCQDSSSDVKALTREQTRALWHQRLGHTNERATTDLHKVADGIPSLPRTDVLHSCPLCARSKLHKSDRQQEEDRPADVCWQHIQIDHGFIVQKSKRKPTARKSTPKRKPRKGRTYSQWQSSARAVRNMDTTVPLNATMDTTVPPRRPRRTTAYTGSYSQTEHSRSRRKSTDENVTNGPIVETVSEDDDSTVADTTNTPTVRPAVPLRERAPVPEERYNFVKIATHAGPLARDHKNFHGHPFSLKILWSNGEKSWVALDQFFEDAPDDVIDYAKKHNLLDNEHWSIVREAALQQAEAAPSLGGFDEEHEDADHDPVLPSADGDHTYHVSERYKALKGLKDETCYVLITDRKSGALKVAVRRDKSPPLDFLKSFIANYAPDVKNKSVRFDGGGDLGGCTEIVDMFQQAGYDVELTAPASSNEIGQVERPHRTIAAAIRTMLYAAGLEYKFWPYALKYYVFIHNMLPHAGRELSSFEICTGKRPDLSLLRIFGCRIYALPAKDRDSKLEVNARAGIFLGYKKSMRNAIYYDLDTKTIKTARHIAFDEGMQDMDDPPPFVRYIKDPESPPPEDIVDLDNTDDFSVVPSAFNDITEVECNYSPDAEHPLGFQVGRDPRFLRAFATSFNRPFGKFDTDKANKKFVGSYIIKIGNYPVFSPDDIARVLDEYSRMSSPPSTLVVRLATDHKSTLSDTRPPSLHLRPADIRRIAAMPLVAGEGTPAQQRAAMRSYANAPLPSPTPADPDDLVMHSADELLEMRQLANDHMTPEERELPSFTRKNLMKLPNWDQWQAADDLQLDTHFKAGTIGHPVPRPPKDPLKPSQVFRLHWARLVKSSGVRKSRACLDGSKRAAPWLRMLVQTYSSCVDLACLRAFIALAVNRGYYICFGDVENAYQQSPPPTIDCYLEIDDTVFDWYLRKFGKKLDKFKDVIPLYRALQGHPEAGVLWERMITDILINKMGFKNTTHEKNLYVGTIDGQEVLVCRQVDDFASAAADKVIAEQFITELRKHVEAEFAGMGIETSSGMYQRYNGIDIFQARDYVMVSCESYLDRVFQTHGWDNPRHHEKEPEKAVPLNPTVAARLQQLEGPKEKTPEAQQIAKRHGFTYRNLLGELIYAYVICRLDIGYSICMLARFSDAPHDEHYKALKGVCRYLRATKHWGIVFQRPVPLMDLPDIPYPYVKEDPDLPSFPVLPRDKLIGFLDAAHATAKNRRSVTGLVMYYGGAAIAWKSRVQLVTATSSTEAEFYAAVACAKLAKYLRYVLMELNALAPGPTELHIDNQAALAMVNESRPTPRARHIEIQHFAIQEWRQKGDIILRHLPGIINPSDDLTKVLGWILHSRHARRSMGHYRLDSSNFGSTSSSF